MEWIKQNKLISVIILAVFLVAVFLFINKQSSPAAQLQGKTWYMVENDNVNSGKLTKDPTDNDAIYADSYFDFKNNGKVKVEDANSGYSVTVKYSVKGDTVTIDYADDDGKISIPENPIKLSHKIDSSSYTGYKLSSGDGGHSFITPKDK